jgi:hypothetical protein
MKSGDVTGTAAMAWPAGTAATSPAAITTAAAASDRRRRMEQPFPDTTFLSTLADPGSYGPGTTETVTVEV